MSTNNPAHLLPKKRIAVLISGKGSNLQAIIKHQQLHSELYEIAVVISNRPQAAGIQYAIEAGIESCVIDHTNYNSRDEFDAVMQETIDNHQIDLVVLAGFMRILTPSFTQHFLGRMLNIHPSLLPKYPGLNTHKQALESGDKEHGLSIHFVTPELDGGPVILQAKVPVSTEDTVESLANKVHQQEHLTYPKVIQWFVEGRLKLQDNHAWLDQHCLQTPVEFSESI